MLTLLDVVSKRLLLVLAPFLLLTFLVADICLSEEISSKEGAAPLIEPMKHQGVDMAACKEQMKAAGITEEMIGKVCPLLLRSDDCQSVSGAPIFHYQKLSGVAKGKKILALSLIHGDELPSGSVAVNWIDRLERIDGRNSWRVIPILSPDGVHQRTRTNRNGVDLNRNFPTKKWDLEALKFWKKGKKSDPRRFPGPNPASEPETKCLISHIEQYQPDFIISIHTPFGGFGL